MVTRPSARSPRPAPAPRRYADGRRQASREPKGALPSGLRSEELATSDEGRRKLRAPGDERDNRACDEPPGVRLFSSEAMGTGTWRPRCHLLPGGPGPGSVQSGCGRHDVILYRSQPAQLHIVPVTAAVALPRTGQRTGLRRRMQGMRHPRTVGLAACSSASAHSRKAAPSRPQAEGAVGDWTEERGACDERRGKEPTAGRRRRAGLAEREDADCGAPEAGGTRRAGRRRLQAPRRRVGQQRGTRCGSR